MKQNKLKIFMLVTISLSSLLSALTIKDATIEELSLESDLIVIGNVKSIDYVWEDQSLKKINTNIQIEVAEYLKGEGNKILEITQMGGRIDDIEDIILGTPKLNINEEILLFLVIDNNKYVIHSIALGCYKIILDEKSQKIAYNNLSNVNLISQDSNGNLQNLNVNKVYKIHDLYREINSHLK